MVKKIALVSVNTPRVQNGLKEATTDPSIITDWWKKWPEANIAIITGHASNIIVFDIDPKMVASPH